MICSLSIRCGLAWLAISMLPAVHSASAASFDCAKASSTLEKNICADPKMSAEDDLLASSYREALKEASASGKDEIRAAQKEWLRFAKITCGFARQNPWSGDLQNMSACLNQKYAARIAELKSGKKSVDNLAFGRTNMYDAALLDRGVLLEEGEKTGEDRGFQSLEIHFPQIEGAVDPHQSLWNHFVKSECSATQKDWQNEYVREYAIDCSITGASPYFISMEIDQYSYEQGSPHGAESMRMINYLLPENRILTEKDIFDLDTDWEMALADACNQIVDNTKGIDPASLPVDSFYFLDYAKSSQNWSLNSKGIRIHFYRIYSHSEPISDCLISWSDLRKFLAKDSVIWRAAALDRN